MTWMPWPGYHRCLDDLDVSIIPCHHVCMSSSVWWLPFLPQLVQPGLLFEKCNIKCIHLPGCPVCILAMPVSESPSPLQTSHGPHIFLNSPLRAKSHRTFQSSSILPYMSDSIRIWNLPLFEHCTICISWESLWCSGLLQQPWIAVICSQAGSTPSWISF